MRLYSMDLSKLPPRSGSVALKQLNYNRPGFSNFRIVAKFGIWDRTDKVCLNHFFSQVISPAALKSSA